MIPGKPASPPLKDLRTANQIKYSWPRSGPDSNAYMTPITEDTPRETFTPINAESMAAIGFVGLNYDRPAFGRKNWKVILESGGPYHEKYSIQDHQYLYGYVNSVEQVIQVLNTIDRNRELRKQ